MTVFSTSIGATEWARKALSSLSCPVLHLQVQRLPKDAHVELHAVAHDGPSPSDGEYCTLEIKRAIICNSSLL